MRDGQVKQPHLGRKVSPSSSTAYRNHCACEQSVQHDNRSEGRDLMSWATDSARINEQRFSLRPQTVMKRGGHLPQDSPKENVLSLQLERVDTVWYIPYTVCKHLLCEDSGRKGLSAGEEMSFLLLASWSNSGILWNEHKKNMKSLPETHSSVPTCKWNPKQSRGAKLNSPTLQLNNFNNRQRTINRNNIVARSRNNCCRGKAICITYSECMRVCVCLSVALVIRHAKRMRCRITLSFVTYPSDSTTFFHIIS